MIDRKTMMWDFLKSIINTPTDLNGMIFIAYSDAADAYEKLSLVEKEAKEKPSSIINNTIIFSGTVFSRCDKIFIHSGESRNSVYGSDVIGKTSPFFTALMTDTVSLISNSSDQKPLHALIISLKRNQILDGTNSENSKGEKYSAQQVWFARCNSVEIISMYSSNMLKYGIMAECIWIHHKMSRSLESDSTNELGNYDVEYGTSADSLVGKK